MKPRTRDKLVTALSCIVGGVVLLLVGLGIIPLDEPMNAPRFVVVLVSGAFIAAGGLLLRLPKRSGLAHVFAFCCYLGLTTAFWWAAIAAPSELFGGDIVWFLPDEMNVLLGRCLFGLVAVLGTGVMVYAPINLLTQRLKSEKQYQDSSIDSDRNMDNSW